MKFCRPHWFPIIFIITATLLLGGLGIWQLERLQWKNSVIAHIEIAQKEPPLTELPPEGGVIYRYASITGSFLHDKRMYFVSQPRSSQPGFNVITPFKMKNGQLVLVNRGWSPRGKESLPKDEQKIEGVIRPMRLKSPAFALFSLKNSAEKNLWFYEDNQEIAQALGAQIPDFIIEQTGKSQVEVYPTPSNGRISIRNDHLGYAITWFTLAFAGIIMFAIYHREFKKS